MMTFTFDLISDLHLETWEETFDWSGRSTSAHAVVIGDLAKDREQVIHCLDNLRKNYQAVFYIDGNDEHKNYVEDLTRSYSHLGTVISKIPNVVFLQDNVVVVDGVAILGTNGWWGFDFDAGIDPSASAEWYAEKENLTSQEIESIKRMSNVDANYMISSVKRLQTHQDVKKIVMVTHTVPHPSLIEHDIGLNGTLRFNTMGNRHMQYALAMDTESKIHTWCFGHYHGDVDQVHGGVRYVNNCRGRGDTPWSKYVYHPKRISVEF
jgi:predicted phosphodiesterase